MNDIQQKQPGDDNIIEIAGEGIDKVTKHVKDGNVAQAYAAGVVTGAAVAIAAIKVGSDIIAEHTDK